MLNCLNRIQFRALFLVLLFFLGYNGQVLALTWQSPPIGLQSDPQYTVVKSDPNGNAFTAWIWEPGAKVQVARFSALTQTYDTPVTVYTGNFPVSLSLATDASGTALMIWHETSPPSIYTAFYNGTSWVTPPPDPLSSLSGGALALTAISMDGSGNGLALFSDGAVLYGNIVASFFNKTTQSWGPLQTLNLPGQLGWLPDVAYSANGTAVAIWRDISGTAIASYYNGSTWSAPFTLGTSATGSGLQLNVGIDSQGNAVAVFWSSDGHTYSRYYTAGSWSLPQDLSLTRYSGFAMNPAGSAVLSANEGYRTFSEGNWSALLPYPPGSATTGSLPFHYVGAAINTRGDILFAINQNIVTDNNDIYSIYKPVGQPPEMQDFVASYISTYLAGVALSDNGRGFISGVGPGEGGCVCATYTITPLPPSSISGRTCNNKFASQTDRVNIIEWTSSQGPSVTAYHLYRNGVLIAVIPASNPYIYYDHNRCKNTKYVYSLTAVNLTGESTPVTLTLK